MIVWGVVASLFAWMRTAMHFYVLRFILGLAESGAYPGTSLCPSRSHWAVCLRTCAFLAAHPKNSIDDGDKE